MAMTTAPFSIRVVGEETGEIWVGDFVAKERLTHRDVLRKDQIRRELLGAAGGSPDARAMSVAFIVSELTVRLTKMPKWFEESGFGLDLEDESVLALVYDKAIKVQLDAQAARKKAAEDKKEELKKEETNE
jgi:hypothetical protein